MALASICSMQPLDHEDPTSEYDELDHIPLVPFSELNVKTTTAQMNYIKPIKYGVNCQGFDINFEHGTTTLAFKFKHGIIVATDSRASAGSYISSSTVEKVLRINKFMLGTMAGGAADCQYWERVLSKQCRLFELRNRQRISIAAASKMLSNMVYNYRGMGLSMGTMITGFDSHGPDLYYIDSDGLRLKGDLFSVGSGSTYALGVIDTMYKFDLTAEAACELGKKAISSATFRDGASGGFVNLYHITENGWDHKGRFDVNELYYKYKDIKPIA